MKRNILNIQTFMKRLTNPSMALVAAISLYRTSDVFGQQRRSGPGETTEHAEIIYNGKTA